MSKDKFAADLEGLDEFIDLPKQTKKESIEAGDKDIYRKNLKALAKHVGLPHDIPRRVIPAGRSPQLAAQFPVPCRIPRRWLSLLVYHGQ